MADKTQNDKHVNALVQTGLSAKSITGLDIWKAAGVDVVEINYVGGPYFIKFRGGQAEVGGTSTWGSGTVLY